MTFWSLTSYSDIPDQSDFPSISWPWYRIWPSPNYEWFPWSVCNGVACHQGTLTLPDTWFRSTFWDLFMLQLLRPVFPNLPCHFSTFHRRYPSALPQFCFCFCFYYFNPEILYFAPISLGIIAYRFLRLFKTTPTDRVKSVRNRCEIEFLWRFCVVTLLFGFFCGCRGFE